jgi:hypothetical protein
MTELDRDAIERIVHAIGDRLDGEWLIVGGAALALWVAPRRLTEDVDVVPLMQTGSERLALLELAEQLGLPIESVNSAADFFVRRIEGWERQLELLHRGARSVVYRPNATLMLLLKLRRLSERDLEDCKLVLATGAAVDRERLERALAELPASDDAALVERRSDLGRRIAGG